MFDSNNQTLQVTVSQKRCAAEDTAVFELVPAEGESLPTFTAGSHIDVHLGDGMIRQYSLSNDPSERHRYVIGVLREADGRGGSRTMHDQVHAGDTMTISTPRNAFELNESARKTLLFAGGIGITPILSMARRLAALGAEFEMHYCARSKERMAFRDEITASGFEDRVWLHFDDGPEDQKLDISGALSDRIDDTHLYVCGPNGFMDAVLSTAKAEWPDEAVHREYFASDLDLHTDGDEAFQVKIASSGETVDVGANQTIAEALLGHGIGVTMSCEQGVCGTCVTRVLEGTPDHRDMVLSETEHAANTEMTVCCSRSKSPLLVLDL
ncbi:PDR/VanB family oxidoreductase [Ruegeria lacuscaerulensis]|uniref:PDR/VanB family oxidoreductase n=1 Tax=Ruegeria lacuscaerulensis TaxID=55218 RepID=UPI0014811169|nr:PDR/VanB family oxidoreductase [Ruegeria lacuscaerulensis]